MRLAATSVGLIDTTGAFFLSRSPPPTTADGRNARFNGRSGSLNDSHNPIIQRPDENDSAVRLVWEETVALECGRCFGKFIRHRVERCPFRCDVSSSPTDNALEERTRERFSGNAACRG
jgi:hypothetical protein